MINLIKQNKSKICRFYLKSSDAYPLQSFVAFLSVIALTVSMISILSNSAKGGDNIKNFKVAFVFMLTCCVINIAGSCLMIFAAFRSNIIELSIALVLISVAAFIWLGLAVAALDPKSHYNLTCIDGYCVETQWICETRWQYSKKDCPFMKEKLELYWPIFRDELRIDEPRDKEYEITSPPPDVIFADFLDVDYDSREPEMFKTNGTQSAGFDRFLREYKAYYKGCEANDPALYFNSVALLVAYFIFFVIRLWSGISYIYEIVHEKNTDVDV